MSQKRKKEESNDFFNLETSSDEDQDEHLSRAEIEKKIKKWDWDKEENFHLYSNYQNRFEIKRNLLVSAEYDTSSVQDKSENLKKLSLTKAENQNQKNIQIQKFALNTENSNSNSKSNILYQLNGHQSAVNRVHWCKKPQNKNLLLSSSMDGKVMIWNLEDYTDKEKQIKVFSNLHTKSIRNAIWSLHETEIISISYDQSCALTDLETCQEKMRFKHSDILTAVCAHPTQENLIQIGSKNEILTLDTRITNNKPVKVYKSKSAMGQVQDLLFLNENEFVSCGDVVSKESAEYSIIVWDFETRASISNQIFHEKYICTCLKKHPFNSQFYAQTHGNYIAEFSTRSPYKMNRFKRFESNGHSTQGYSIGFDINSSGSLIASGSRDGSVYVYNSSTGKLVNKIEAFSKEIVQEPCLDAKFQPCSTDGSYSKPVIAASSWNGVIKIFSLF